MNKEIQQLIELMEQDNNGLHSILSDYPVKKLEEIAIRLGGVWIREQTPDCQLLGLILNHRKWKLDAEFVFPSTAIEKIRWLDAQVMKCQGQLIQKAQREILHLKGKSTNYNPFRDEPDKDYLLDNYDYRVECKITPYIFAEDAKQEILFDTYAGIDEILSCMLPKYILHFEGETEEQLHANEYFKEKLNWNECAMPSKVALADLYISWGMHELCGHSFFSLSDILRINYLCGEIKTIQEHWIEL